MLQCSLLSSDYWPFCSCQVFDCQAAFIFFFSLWMPSCLYFLDHYLIAKMSLFLSIQMFFLFSECQVVFVMSFFFIAKPFCFCLFSDCQAVFILSVLCVPSCLFYVYFFISKLSLFCIFFDGHVVFVLSILWLPSCLCFVYSLSANLFLFSLFPDCQAGFVFLSNLGNLQPLYLHNLSDFSGRKEKPFTSPSPSPTPSRWPPWPPGQRRTDGLVPRYRYRTCIWCKVLDCDWLEW